MRSDVSKVDVMLGLWKNIDLELHRVAFNEIFELITCRRCRFRLKTGRLIR